ncbi:antitoxin [Sphingomonas parapaucimobilis]|uniref:antitoxin n=1 Tax=Sphingomonas parapaucimobilis TaxID=28213 RepID=UPI0035C83D87
MEHEPGIFEQRDEGAELAADERARADFRAGRFVSHEKMAEWLKTWGTPDRKPLPPEWLK